MGDVPLSDEEADELIRECRPIYEVDTDMAHGLEKYFLQTIERCLWTLDYQPLLKKRRLLMQAGKKVEKRNRHNVFLATL